MSCAATARMMRLPFLWRHAQRVKKGASPSQLVYEEDRLRLLHYLSEEPRKSETPLLFVFALVNRPYILDLLPQKSVVGQFVKAGFDVYLIDWKPPAHADRHWTLDHYVNVCLRNVVDYLRQRSGSEAVSVLGYCMGGTMSAIFAALYPERVRNLILMAAGIDFAARDGLINLWTDAKYFDADGFVDAFGNCSPQFLQAMFLMLKPVDNLIVKPLGFFERLNDGQFIDEYFTMETWLGDNVPVAGEVFRQFVKDLYQQNLLVQNRLPLGSQVVNLKRITCPVLNLMASNDDLVPCSQSEPFNDLVGSADRKSMKIAAGHIGLAVGSKAHRELWPQVCRWLAERS
jgi:polyhydroxyalkanoate synthase